MVFRQKKVFVSHTSEERVNDNADPHVANLSSFRFNDQKHLFYRPGKFSLVVLDRFAGWMKTLSPSDAGVWSGGNGPRLPQAIW